MSDLPSVDASEVPDDAVIIDVREADEWAAGHAPGAIHIPMGDVPARLDEIPPTDETLPVICRSGGRSSRVVQWLVQQGFDVINVDGGLQRWALQGKALTSDGDSEPYVL